MVSQATQEKLWIKNFIAFCVYLHKSSMPLPQKGFSLRTPTPLEFQLGVLKCLAFEKPPSPPKK